MGAFKNITVGEKFGNLVYLGEAGKVSKERFVFARCVCGKEGKYRLTYLNTGHTSSCGCLRAEKNRARSTHGHSPRGAHTPCYSAYRDMRTRCENPKYREFHLYGGRGITVCERWRQGYEFFLADMGEPQHGLTLERVRVNEGYSPENCIWATISDQANNKRNSVFIELNGRRQTVAQWARELGILDSTIYFRVSKGWPPERSLSPTK